MSRKRWIRVLSLILAAFLMIGKGNLGMAASGRTGESGYDIALSAGKATFTVDEITAKPGDSVEIPVSITSNPGFAGVLFELQYDEDALSLTGVENGSLLSSDKFSVNTANKTVQWYTEGENVTGTGLLFTMKFAVDKNAPNGKHAVSFTIKEENLTNYDFENVPFEIVPGSVTVLGEEPPTPQENIPVSSIQLTPSSLNMKTNAQATLVATVQPSNATDRTVTWSSSRDEIATVSQEGLVRALAVGTATITVAANDGSDVKASCEVTVSEDTTGLVEGIHISRTTLIVSTSGYSDVSAYAYPVAARNRKIAWSIEDESIAYIYSDYGYGEVRIAGRSIGTTVLRATATDGSGVVATCAIEVKDIEMADSSSDLGKNPEDEQEALAKGGIPEGVWVAGIRDSYLYTGYAQKPEIRIYHGSRRLREKKEYKLSYQKNTNVGKATIKITGVGSYNGSVSREFVIAPVSLAQGNEDVVAFSETKGAKTVVSVYCNGKKLSQNKDYTISGTGASTTITGKGNFTDSRMISSESKALVPLSKTNVSMSRSLEYTGQEVELSDLSLTDRSSGKELEENEHYRVEYISNVNVGTATAMIIGLESGGYTGVLKKTFKITPAEISVDNLYMDDAYDYWKGGTKPGPTVTFGDGYLREGVDYTLKYKNNSNPKNVGKTNAASVIIKGMGNFKGTVQKSFTVVQSSLEYVYAVCPNIKYMDGKPVNYYRAAPILYDMDMKKLAVNKDYMIKQYVNGSQEKALEDSDVKANDEIEITIEGIGGYKDEIKVRYSVVGTTPKDLSKAKMNKLPVQAYTGGAIEPSIVFTHEGRNLEYDDDYEIYYYNNVKKGTALVLIDGSGNYSGGKVFKFKIGPRNIGQ